MDAITLDQAWVERASGELRASGFCIVPDVLDARSTAFVRERLVAAADEYTRRGSATFMPELDPNDRNVRVFDLLDLDAVFRELIMHPVALELVRAILSETFMISNFTANVSRPGSDSMALHSDQAFVAPEPWIAPWSANVIWCLDDVFEANGATRYLPDSHRVATFDDLPADAIDRTLPFEAAAGSIIVVEGRMWHTSGRNVTDDAERALLFGYYSADFVRPQVNWSVVLAPETRARIPGELADRLGLGRAANVAHAARVMALSFNHRATSEEKAS